MEFQGVFQKTVTIPTGATSGARITIDGDRGAIFVYSTNNNLIGSMAGSAGTDGFGNAYPVGITEYADVITNIAFTNIFSGIVYEGFLATRSSTPDYNHISFLTANTNQTSEYQSPWIAGTSNIQLLFTAGTGSVMGSTAPSLQFQTSGAISSSLYASILGALVGGDPTNGIATWQNVGTAVPFKANWSAGNAFSSFGGGSGVLRFRKTNEDEGKLTGIAVAAAGATATIFTLPSGFFNTVNTTFIWAGRNRAGTITWVPVAIDTSGNVMTLAPATGDQYLFDVTWDIGNIP